MRPIGAIFGLMLGCVTLTNETAGPKGGLKSARIFVYRVVSHLLPETRCFGLKAGMLRWAGAHIGPNVRICSSARILGTGRLVIDEDVWIGHDVMICSTSCIRIGKCVDIGPRVYIGTGTHVLDVRGTHSAGAGLNLDVRIEDGAWLGAGCIVLPGVTIGHKAVAAAAAVVAADVPARTLVGGVPAKFLRSLDNDLTLPRESLD